MLNLFSFSTVVVAMLWFSHTIYDKYGLESSVANVHKETVM